ncbi:chromate transporter [Metaclostridioides mangenotii]|uniref:chromate transporter n=1 Tax=Metaclostridioides mangenotii TaxID=1540 RepID=UPI0028EAC92D|nr:chromate transporter [Clostridioides mangenotii]
MSKIILLFLLFFKIGAFSFGGGYAMLPFIQQEFITKNHLITSQEFLDLLAISQSTPGPVAINSATFVGFKTAGILGSLAATIGVSLFAIIGLTIISRLFDKFRDNEKIENLLTVLRPITIGFILAAAFSSGKDVPWNLYAILAFITSYYLLYKKKIGSIVIIFIYGAIGIALTFIM